MRTYGQLEYRSLRLASVLAGLGVGPGRPVAAVLPNGVEIFEVATAASMLDAPYLPVNWHLRADELAFILADADVAVAVGHEAIDGELHRGVEGLGVPTLSVGRDYEERSSAADPSVRGRQRRQSR